MEGFPVVRGGKLQCARSFPVSVCVIFSNVLLTKESHVAEPRVSMGGGCPGRCEQTGGITAKV